MKTKNTTLVRTNNHGYVPLVVSIIPSFPLLWLITWFLLRITRRVQLVKQDLHIIPEHSSSPTIVSGDGFALNVYFLCSILTSMVCLFALFLFAIVLYIIIRVMASDYHFGTFKRFFYADLHSSLVYQDQVWYRQNVYNKTEITEIILKGKRHALNKLAWKFKWQ